MNIKWFAPRVHVAWALIVATLFVGGCTREARMYPMNDTAAGAGALLVKFKAYGTGHGGVEINTPDGETLNGEYVIVRDGVVGFGSIYGAAWGGGSSASVVGNSTFTSMARGSPGTASAIGNKGTTMECEFYNDNVSGHGTGGCKSSKGAIYKLMY